MNTNDSSLSSEKQNKNIKRQHMFQINEDSLNEPQLNQTFDLDISQHLSKISRSYKSIIEDKNLEIKTNSLVSCAKSLIETSSHDLTQSLTDYLDALKEQYTIKRRRDDIKKEPVEDEITEEITLNKVEEISIDQDQTVDIDEIFKKSEKEVLTFDNQKVLLQSLINDINVNSSTKAKSNYNDHLFERNMNDIINESREEFRSHRHSMSTDSDEILDDEVDKKGKSSLILTMIIFALLAVAGYMYKDMIIDLLKNVPIQELQNILDDF